MGPELESIRAVKKLLSHYPLVDLINILIKRLVILMPNHMLAKAKCVCQLTEDVLSYLIWSVKDPWITPEITPDHSVASANIKPDSVSCCRSSNSKLGLVILNLFKTIWEKVNVQIVSGPCASKARKFSHFFHLSSVKIIEKYYILKEVCCARPFQLSLYAQGGHFCLALKFHFFFTK